MKVLTSLGNDVNEFERRKKYVSSSPNKDLHLVMNSHTIES